MGVLWFSFFSREFLVFWMVLWFVLEFSLVSMVPGSRVFLDLLV